MFFAPALTRRVLATARPLLPITLSLAALRRVLLAAGCLAALLVPALAHAQNPGDLDTTFTSSLVGGNFYAFTFEELDNIEYIFIAGDSGLSEREIASSGMIDASFGLEAFGFPDQRIIYTAVQETVTTLPYYYPKVLIGGLFGRDAAQTQAMEPGQNIKRFVPSDGSLDPTFDPGTGANNYVTAILPLVDKTSPMGVNSGDMIVGGEFDQFNKVNHERIVKLDNSGAIVDNSLFDGSLSFDATVLSLAQQYTPDPSGTYNGQILVAGIFSNVNNLPHAKLARINADGSVDASFNPVFSDRVRIVVSEPGGKILAGGDFETVNGMAVKHLVRLNYDGSIDTTFNCQVTAMPAEIDAPVAVNTITPLGDGRYYIGGNFYKLNGVSRHYLGRVLNDGTVDEFDPGTTLTNTVQQVAIDPITNKVFVTENRDKSVNNIYPASVFRLYGDPPGVAISAAEDIATQSQEGKFLLTRTNQDTSLPIRVYVTRGGTAKNADSKKANGDYRLRPVPARTSNIDGQKGFVLTIPAGKESINVKVDETPTARLGRTVTLTVQPDQSGTNSYAVEPNPTATVTLE